MEPVPVVSVEAFDDDEAKTLFLALVSFPADHPEKEWAEEQAFELVEAVDDELAGEMLADTLSYAVQAIAESARQEGREEARFMDA